MPRRDILGSGTRRVSKQEAVVWSDCHIMAIGLCFFLQLFEAFLEQEIQNTTPLNPPTPLKISPIDLQFLHEKSATGTREEESMARGVD